ncbi:MAG: hypothetical protein SFV15_26975 [Polyangiaceae bacterium]|nr:hypothetical protein [Polyangiaceae bacterium]
MHWSPRQPATDSVISELEARVRHVHHIEQSGLRARHAQAVTPQRRRFPGGLSPYQARSETPEDGRGKLRSATLAFSIVISFFAALRGCLTHADVWRL